MLKKSLEDRNTPIIGSKVVFSGSRKYTRLDFTDLGIAIDKDIKIIYTINNSSYSISAKLHFALNKKAILNERDKGFGEIIWQKKF